MEPCCPLTNKSNQIETFTMDSCSQKQRKRVINEESESGFESLSSITTDHLLTEILIRLPSKSVCRCKAVCKQWCGIISTSYFISRFINHHRQLNLYQVAPNSFTLVFQIAHRSPSPGIAKYLYPVDAISNHPSMAKSYKTSVNINLLPLLMADAERRMVFGPLDPKLEPIYVLASCHDLLLCCHNDKASYYVINVLTRQWIMLPPKPLHEYDLGMTALTRYLYLKAGFLCYHDQSDINNGYGWYKFKVILIPGVISHRLPYPPPPTPEIHSSQFTIQIYSSELRQWTNFIVDWYPLSLNAYLSPAPILSHNGMLHWLNGHSLVVFDPFNGGVDLDPTRLTHYVKLPDELVLKTRNAFFGVCQGHFQVARITREEAIKTVLVWELEDYHKGVWQLAHKVLLDKSPLKRFSADDFSFMSFHPFNKDIVFMGVSNVIYQFNMRTGKSKRYGKLRYDRFCRPKLLPKVSTLLHQWFPTPVPGPTPMQN